MGLLTCKMGLIKALTHQSMVSVPHRMTSGDLAARAALARVDCTLGSPLSLEGGAWPRWCSRSTPHKTTPAWGAGTSGTASGLLSSLRPGTHTLDFSNFM